MCGICGIVYRDGRHQIDPQRLSTANDQIIHRGPDESGIYLDGPAGLAHRRLSIIDVSDGHQPMSNEDRSVWVAFNGEIYNYKALRERLVAKGHHFATRSDTEVLVHLYEEEGPGLVRHLDGMFAFALWDGRQRTLLLARDRLGKKPLYYVEQGDFLAFASEIKALLPLAGVRPSRDEVAAAEYFIYGYVGGENTLYDGVRRLPPGHVLTLKDGRSAVSCYWEPGQQRLAQPERSMPELLATLDGLLNAAVEKRLMSEVPLGTFNSGGLDSSLVTAIASSKVGRAINSFSVSFAEQEFDESRYAKLVSEACGTNHHVLQVNRANFAASVSEALVNLDEPLHHPNSVAIMLLSKFAKQKVTVVLTGEGADELFGGYPRYFLAKLRSQMTFLPPRARKLLGRAMAATGNRKAAKIGEVLQLGVRESIVLNEVEPEQAALRALLGEDRYHAALERRLATLNAGEDEALDALLRHELGHYLSSILNRADKMTMAGGLEARAPFLDHDIVDFCRSLPLDVRLHGWTTKYLLKRYSTRYLSTEIVMRPKSGFGIPIGEWFRDPSSIGAWLDGAARAAPVQVEQAQRLIAQHKAHQGNHDVILWRLANWKLWEESALAVK